MHCETVIDNPDRATRNRRHEVARIRSKLILAQLTLSKIDEGYRLPSHTASNTLYEPHLAGERAIAAALRTRPEFLWPSRYFADGRRKSPQPAENYRNGRRAPVAA
ncbi:helix-turn-helix domain-containing protein [Rhizobium sp. YJ-22]|uniref:helix-turn-helix domain-containing protein n=1 Tax=Rhizobium sp. YJ-22 TaxID=3037556 RepID=UPI002412888F|nr:helix-turn-helix domain-containing protein [Rhizobium sp. YJ-22]MDG3580378.1 helix-turn-helix domain-containing protein [Rhizobium sp. YJ-22]